jgi:DNA-binding GntR family transcriptional regulator
VNSVPIAAATGFEQHSQLLALFRAGDLARFEKLMRAHVAGTRNSYVASLKTRTAA